MALIDEIKASVSCECSSEKSVMEQYSKDNSIWAKPKLPTCVVWPRSVEDVQNIIKIANRYNESVIPVSSGVHFYGSTIPTYGGIVVDLSKMTRIEVDKRNKNVVIEPGVRWSSLQDEVSKVGLRVINPFLPHATQSVLSSILERVPPVVWKSEYKERICSLEVVLPNGDIFRTGSASVSKTGMFPASGVVPYGPGLNWHYLFQGAQGSFGIVTRMRIKAEVKPTLEKLVFNTSSNIEELVDVVYSVGKLLIGYECLLLNNLSLASLIADVSEDITKLKSILPGWTLILCLGGLRHPDEKIAYEEEAIKRLGVDIKPTIPRIPGVEKKIFGLLKKAWDEDLYWKFRYKGKSQDIFFICSLSKLSKFFDILFESAIEHNYSSNDFGIYIQPLEYGRAAYCEIILHYNPESIEEVNKTKDLVRDMCDRLGRHGAFFHRPYGPMAEVAYGFNTSYTSLLTRLKDLFDPNNIMNPGRLYLR